MQGVDWTEADRVERAGALEPFGLPMYLLHVNAHAQFMSQLAWATQCSTCVNISSRVFWFDIKWFLCGFCWNISGIFKVRFLTFLYCIFRVSRPQISKSSELFLRLDCQKWLFLCFDFDCSKTFVLWRCPNSHSIPTMFLKLTAKYWVWVKVTSGKKVTISVRFGSDFKIRKFFGLKILNFAHIWCLVEKRMHRAKKC